MLVAFHEKCAKYVPEVELVEQAETVVVEFKIVDNLIANIVIFDRFTRLAAL